MRDMLEPIFGESGAVVAQFFIAVIALLILVGIVYWVFRRFGGVRFVGIGRRRIPRLAIIDALPVDSRHKLVLIRRDNVEHLVLIGGSANLIVEPSIIRSAQAVARVRQAQAPRPQHQPAAAASASLGIGSAPPTQPASQMMAMPDPRAETTGISEPIPFPQTAQPHPDTRGGEREVGAPEENDTAKAKAAPQPQSEVEATALAVEPVAANAPPADTPPANTANQVSGHGSAHFEEPTRASEIESVLLPASAPAEFADEPASTADLTEFTDRELSQDTTPPATAVSATAEDELESGSEAVIEKELESSAEAMIDVEPQPAPAVALDESPADTDGSEANDAKSAAKVSDLEHEMVRLLGEITTKRDD